MLPVVKPLNDQHDRKLLLLKRRPHFEGEVVFFYVSFTFFSDGEVSGRHRRKNMTATIGLVVHAAGKTLQWSPLNLRSANI